MKILLCSPYEPVIKENAGGIAMWAKHLIDFYKEVESDVEIDVMPYNRSIYVHDGLNRFVRVYKGAKDYISLIWQTRRKIKENKYDVLHLCSSALLSIIRDYFVMRMAQRFGVSGVLHFHCGRVPKIAANGGWKWRILKSAVAKASAAVVLDDESYSVLLSHGFKNVYKVPNPLSEQMSNRIEQMSVGVQRVPRRLLFVGHVLPSKGVYELVKACAGIPDIQLHLIGRVEESVRADLLEIASSKKESWMFMHGEMTHESVLQEMLSCDIFVFPSYTEGFPNVIIEAMACGTPIIASGVGAIPEMLDNGKCGMIIAPHSSEEFRNAVNKLISDNVLKSALALNAKERVNREYSVLSVWNKLVNLWKKTTA